MKPEPSRVVLADTHDLHAALARHEVLLTAIRDELQKGIKVKTVATL